MTAPGDPGDGPANEPVGSLAEEAARLFDVLRDLGRDQGADFARQAEAATTWAAAGVHDLEAHVATGADECRYCPICRLIAFARSTSPEVRAHLGDAAASLVKAAAGMLATEPPTADPDPENPEDPS